MDNITHIPTHTHKQDTAPPHTHRRIYRIRKIRFDAFGGGVKEISEQWI